MRSVIENRLSCEITRFQDLDLNHIAKETEGFAAKDFTMVVERAVEFSFAARKIHNKQGNTMFSFFLLSAWIGVITMYTLQLKICGHLTTTATRASV